MAPRVRADSDAETAAAKDRWTKVRRFMTTPTRFEDARLPIFAQGLPEREMPLVSFSLACP